MHISSNRGETELMLAWPQRLPGSSFFTLLYPSAVKDPNLYSLLSPAHHLCGHQWLCFPET